VAVGCESGKLKEAATYGQCRQTTESKAVESGGGADYTLPKSDDLAVRAVRGGL
jgi:hypothetical protein